MSNIYDEYIILARTIVSQDNEDDIRGKVVCVYDMLDSEKLVGIFSRQKYCADLFKTDRHNIACNLTRGNLRNCRYKIEMVKI